MQDETWGYHDETDFISRTPPASNPARSGTVGNKFAFECSTPSVDTEGIGLCQVGVGAAELR